jgi:FkbM family methyltransferase
MRKMKKFFRTFVNSVFHQIPWSLLEKLEGTIQLELGKGWGSATTEIEARAVAKLAKDKIEGEIVVLDVGANVGDWSASIQRFLPNSRVIAFEPSKVAFEKLSVRFRNSDRFSCFNLAVGRENSKSFLYADSSASGLGSLTKRRVKHFGISFEHKEQIDLVTLDEWIKNQNPKVAPNVIKMDVEGHELDVLIGANTCLKNVHVIQFEFGGSNIDTKTYFQDFWYFFEATGFEIYRVTPRGLKVIPRYSEDLETFRPTNYLAARKG